MTDPRPKKGGGGISDRTANIIVVGVTVLWVTSMAAAIVTGSTALPDFKPPEAINGAFLLVIGLALRAKSKDGE